MAVLDRHAFLDVFGACMLSAIEHGPADLAGVEQCDREPWLIPLRFLAVETDGDQVGLAAQAKRNWQRDVVPAAPERISVDRESDVVDPFVDQNLVVRRITGVHRADESDVPETVLRDSFAEHPDVRMGSIAATQKSA